MTFVIDEKTVGLWFCPMPQADGGGPADVMMGMSEIPGPAFVIVWRVRYYGDFDPLGANDRKSWHVQRSRPGEQSREFYIEFIRRTLATVAGGGIPRPELVDEVLMTEAGLADFNARLDKLPHLMKGHVEAGSPEEAMAKLGDLARMTPAGRA